MTCAAETLSASCKSKWFLQTDEMRTSYTKTYEAGGTTQMRVESIWNATDWFVFLEIKNSDEGNTWKTAEKMEKS